MCRLAYIGRPFRGMSTWLHRLEESAGGDGNGVAVGKRAIKGADISVAETVDAIHDLQRRRRGANKKGGMPALWHTRRTSSGYTCDELCHPFECDGGWLVHNGHWGAGHFAALAFQKQGEMSDTRYFSTIVERVGFADAVDLHEPSGVWLHMKYDGSLAVFKRGGSLWVCPGMRVCGSEPGATGKWYAVQDGYYDYDDLWNPENYRRTIQIDRSSWTPSSYRLEDDEGLLW